MALLRDARSFARMSLVVSAVWVWAGEALADEPPERQLANDAGTATSASTPPTIPPPAPAPAASAAQPPEASPAPKGPEPAAEGAEASAKDSWSDASLHLAWGPTYHEPAVTDANGNALNISKTTVTVTYVSGDAFGGNFANVDYLQSDHNDPAVNSSSGASEIYAILRRDFSLNKLTRSNAFSFFVVRDVGIEIGADLNVKNTAFAPNKRFFLAGPTLSFKVPGFWVLGVYVDKEWNHNGFSHDEGHTKSGGTVEFDPTAMVASAWSIPLGPTPFLLEGFASLNLPKGRDGFGDSTLTEVEIQPKLMWDVSCLWSKKLHGYLVGVGYQYWLNMYGNDHATVPGSESSSVFFEVAAHL